MMAATLADRSKLAAVATFVDRVTGAVLVFANTVGSEASSVSGNTQRGMKRIALVNQVLANPDTVGQWFARAAAGAAMASTYADATGTDDVKQAAITDATISAYVAVAWDVIASVLPWERGA